MGDGWRLGRESVLARGARAGAEPGRPAGFVPAKEKYAVEGPIGRGGMGEVLLVTDHDLRRQVAMKVLHAESADDEEMRLHFVAEAQATSQLEHPGIPPVHDIGVAPDGRLYFTMKLVRGRTLREVIHDLFVKRPEVQKEWTLHRLVSVLERLCETLHFAHERGVVHRDLKPENVMLGDYGEVHVMDWGLARVEGSETPSSDDAIETARTAAGMETQTGAIKGTLPYMAPEQLSGVADRRSDVYALGCLLYEVLTLHPAYDPHEAGLLEKLARGAFPAVETRNPRRAVPPALAEICRAAMAKDPGTRPPTAKDLGAALRGWLDGTSERERRHREAEAFAAKGIEAVVAYERTREAETEADAEVERQAREFKAWQPIAEKRPLLAARKRLDEANANVALAFAEALKWFDGALVQEERNATARAALANLWKGRLDDAERRGDRADVAYALTMVRRYDDGGLRDYVAGDGTLTLATEPAGAEATLYRYVERDGVLVAEEERSLGRTPLGPVPLPMGSYLCVLKKPGFPDVRYPVHISRNRAWEGRVRLRTGEEIGEGFVYVPAGPFVYGEGKTTRILDLPDFAIARFPVTFGEYGEFLAAVDRAEGPEAAMRRLPHSPGGGDPSYMARQEDGTYGPQPHIVEGAAHERCAREHGADYLLRVPVMGLCFHDAVAYCAWKTKATGKEWRLPTEEEREKAARGVDGRRFPWGEVEDASLAKCRDSREEAPQPEPVGSFATAESVYGMGDAAGNVWDWTDSWFDARHSSHVLRGGSFAAPPVGLRIAYRLWDAPAARNTKPGFRCARGL